VFFSGADNPVGWIVGGVVAVVVATYGIHEYYDPFLSRLKYQWRAAKWAGLAQVYPVTSYPGFKFDSNNDVKALSDKALRDLAASSQELRLLLASGWRLIGCEKYPGLLYDALKGRQGSRLVALLLDPASEPAKLRADKCAMTPDEYANGIQAVLQTLKNLRDIHGLKVEAHFYDEDPIWQMVLSESEIWMLCASQNVTSGRSPVYCLKRDAPYGLAFGMAAVWERRLKIATPINLDTLQAPTWPKLKSVANS
jgi:hypothetical protein